MARPGPYEELFNLPILGEMVIVPELEEGPEAALKRLKLRASKYRSQDRSYRMKIVNGHIHVQRTPFGLNTKMSDLLMMKAGQRMLLKSNADPSDRRKATSAAFYLNTTRYRNLTRGDPLHHTKSGFTGYWEIEIDVVNRLIAYCGVDVEGQFDEHLSRLSSPLLTPWMGEWS